jgi:hypothetical protein
MQSVSVDGVKGCYEGSEGVGRSRRRFRLLKLVAAVLIMRDAIMRLFEGARPIDRTVLVVDLLVLLVIVIEYGHSLLRERKKGQRELQRRRRLEFVRQAMSNGQELQRKAPYVHAPNLDVAEWKHSVNSWVQNTQTLLRSYSAQAEASFLHDPHSIPANYPTLATHEYHLLVIRLNNLRGIMEKPEVYF